MPTKRERGGGCTSPGGTPGFRLLCPSFRTTAVESHALRSCRPSPPVGAKCCMPSSPLAISSRRRRSLSSTVRASSQTPHRDCRGGVGRGGCGDRHCSFLKAWSPKSWTVPTHRCTWHWWQSHQDISEQSPLIGAQGTAVHEGARASHANAIRLPGETWLIGEDEAAATLQ